MRRSHDGPLCLDLKVISEFLLQLIIYLLVVVKLLVFFEVPILLRLFLLNQALHRMPLSDKLNGVRSRFSTLSQIE